MRDTSGAAGGAAHGSPATFGFHSSETFDEMAAGNGVSDETTSNIQHEIKTQEAAVKKEYQYPP